MIGKENKNDGTELVIVQDRTSEDKKKSFFEFIQKVDGQWVVTAKDSVFSGDLKSIQHGLKYDISIPKQRELAEKYKNRPVIKLQLVDREANQTYLYKFNLRLATRTLINRVLALESTDGLAISIWNDRETGNEKISLKQHGKPVDWKYGLDEVPKPEELRKKNGELISRDFDEVDKFFLDKIDEFNASKKKSHTQSEPVVKEPVATKAEISEDDIPF